MALIPSQDIAQELSTKTLNGDVYTFGTNIFAGEEADGDSYPDKCIFFYDDGGPAPLDRMGVTTSDHEVRVEMIVRGLAHGGESDGVKTGADARRYLHGSKPTGYDIVLVDQSIGLRLINDAKGRPRWKYTFRARYEETSLP